MCITVNESCSIYLVVEYTLLLVGNHVIAFLFCMYSFMFSVVGILSGPLPYLPGMVGLAIDGQVQAQAE